MATASFIVGTIGSIISILLYLSPVSTFTIIAKTKSTGSFEGFPYVCTLLNASLWAFYGLLKPGGLIILMVNSAGAFLQAIYVVLFIVYAPKDTKVKYLKLAGILNVGCLGLVIVIILLAFHGHIQLTIVGFLGAGLTLGMYASPLSAMRRVIMTKCVDYMPLCMSFFLFLNGGIWSTYAVLVKDFFIGVPNVIGFLFGSAQLIVYIAYKNRPVPTKSTEKLEEGSLDLALEIGGNVDNPKKEISG